MVVLHPDLKQGQVDERMRQNGLAHFVGKNFPLPESGLKIVLIPSGCKADVGEPGRSAVFAVENAKSDRSVFSGRLGEDLRRTPKEQRRTRCENESRQRSMHAGRSLHALSAVCPG
jgi:hypothetical protein